MSRLTVLAFLVALTEISIVHGQGDCEKPVGTNPKRNGWGGKCFGTQDTLSGEQKCDVLVPGFPFGVPPFPSINGCNWDKPTCCVTACRKQTRACNRKFKVKDSVGINTCDWPIISPNLRKLGEVRKYSGCYCCKVCKRRSFCWRKGGICITEDDTVHNVAWCKAKGWKIRRGACYGRHCWCCYPQ